MRISRKKTDTKLQKKVESSLFQTLADLSTSKQVETFLRDFLTQYELSQLAKRLFISYMLEKNTPYNLIKKQLNVSSATVAQVQSMIDKDKGGLTLALKKIEAENWADEKTKAFSDFFKKILS